MDVVISIDRVEGNRGSKQILKIFDENAQKRIGSVKPGEITEFTVKSTAELIFSAVGGVQGFVVVIKVSDCLNEYKACKKLKGSPQEKTDEVFRMNFSAGFNSNGPVIKNLDLGRVHYPPAMCSIQ